MTELFKRLHTWVGLFNLTALVVFAVAGVSATFPPRAPRATEVRTLDYRPAGTMTDREIAADLFVALKLPLAGPVPDGAVHRNDRNELALEFYSPNGSYRVTVLERDQKVRIERTSTPLAEFIEAMHTTTFTQAPPDIRLRMWGLYMDASIFSLLFMAVTGPALWLASRPRLWWARLSFGLGIGLAAVLWLVTR